MVDYIYRSDRRFQVWRYIVSHKQLLLRSPKDNENSTRIDLLFKVVDLMNIPTSLKGLALSKAADNSSAVLPINFALSQGSHIFRVDSSSYVGYVVAAYYFFHEDEKEYDDESAFQSILWGGSL